MLDIRGGQYTVTNAQMKQRVDYRIDGEIYEPTFDFVATVQRIGGELPKPAPIGVKIVGVIDSPFVTFLAVKIPESTVEHLAASVLLDEPCGPHLVDCLIEQDIFDLEGEFAKKVRKQAIDEVLKIIDGNANDCHREGEYGEAACLSSIAVEIRSKLGV